MTPEEHLRTVLTDDRHALPAWTDPVGRVSRGVTRRRWRRRAGVAAGLAAVALAVAAVPAAIRFTATPEPPAGPFHDMDIVPWRPAPRPALPPAPLRPRLPQARACQAHDLAPPDQVGGEPMMRGRRSLTLFNESATRCTVVGWPAIVVTDPRDGRRFQLPVEPAVIDTLGDPPATLEPRERAMIDVVLTDDCTAQPTETYESPALYAAGREFPIENLIFRVGCLVRLAHWQIIQPELSAPDLEVRVDVPDTVRRGHPLVYLVTLRNTGAAPMPLDPCPVFSQDLTGNERPAEFHQFNCPPGGIAPGGSLRFELRTDVPAGTAPGYQHLIWRAVAPERGVFEPQPGTWDVVLITE
jgi:hypothetical protein